MDIQSGFSAKIVSLVKGWLVPPDFKDEEENRIARILNIILWAIIAVVSSLIVIWLTTGKSDQLGPYAFFANGIIIAASTGLLFLVRSGQIKMAGLIFVIFLWGNITFQAFTSDGVRGSAAILYITIMVLAGLLVGWRASIAFAVLSTISIWTLAHVEVIGRATFQTPQPYEVALESTAMFVLVALFLTLTTTGLSNALQRARSSEKSLKESNRSLQENLAELARREEELRESEERFRVLFEHAPDPFFFLRIDGALAAGNKTGQEFTGYMDGELVDRNILEIGIVTPEDLPKAAKILQQSRNGEPTGPDEFALNRKDGTPIFAELSTHPVNIKGEKFVLCIARDITGRKNDERERKRLEAQLQQAQKMEAIGTLAGGIAHDFNNILGAVIGYTELAQHEVEKDTVVYQYLQDVLHAGHRAKDLVKQILTFSRQTDKEHTPVQLKTIINEVVRFLRASLPATIEVFQKIQSDALVMGDPTQIHQVILNLCTNAGFAMRDQGGRLTLGLIKLELDADAAANFQNLKPGPYLKVTVSDTGPGIPAGMLDRIFEPFFTTKDKGEGTGMGLAVVHGIVADHGGDIFVQSEPGRGTTFTVFLPAVERSIPSESGEDTPAPTGSERILFIDDEAALATAGKRLLESLGYKVTTRTSSVEALKLFKTQPDRFDLVITDMTMPTMTGDKLAREMMDIRSDLPIILCSGFSARMSETVALDLGIRAFINKPIDRRRIAQTIRRILDQGSG